MDLKEYLLTKVSEEASEIIKVVAKAQLHGLDDINPHTGNTNYVELSGEYSDLNIAMAMLGDYLEFSALPNPFVTSDRLIATGLDEGIVTHRMCRVAMYAASAVAGGTLQLSVKAKEFLHRFYTFSNYHYIIDLIDTSVPTITDPEFYARIRTIIEAFRDEC